MRKFLALAALGALVLCALFGNSVSDPKIAGGYKTVVVKWRTRGNALSGQTPQQINDGYIDSTGIYNGATADLDTSATIDIRDMLPAIDSLQYLAVELNGTQAWAAGESVYVTFDNMTSTGQLQGNLGLATCSVCAPGGYHAAASFVPGTTTSGQIRYFNGAGSATSGHVAQALFAGPGRLMLYGNFSTVGWLRLRLHSDYATAPVVQLITVQLHYLSSDSKSF